MDLKLKNYSSGMSVRLGFSVAVQVDADVLLVDEVLAVGDGAFQRKCFDEFSRMRAQGKTILLVTHDMSAVERFCDRAMLLERGSVVAIGPPDRDRAGVQRGQLRRRRGDADGRRRPGGAPAQSLVRGRRRGAADDSRARARPVTSAWRWSSLRRSGFPIFTVMFRNEVRHLIFMATSIPHPPPGEFRAGERATVRFSFQNQLAPSHYMLTPAVGEWEENYAAARPARGGRVADRGVLARNRRGGRPAHRASDRALVNARPLAPSYRGPSALGDDLRRFVNLTVMLAVTDFKLRFFGSALGYLWTLMRPLLLFGVLYFVFTEVVRFGDDIQDYPVYLLTAIVMFTFFSETTGRGVKALVERENLLRKVRFPRLVIPLAVALHSLFNLGLNLIVVFVFVFASGIELRVTWLELIPLVILLVAFSTSVTMLLSALYVRYRDMQPIWEVALQILFYASPVIYVMEFLPDSIQEPAMANPLAAILTQMRYALIDPTAPSAAEVIGGLGLLLIPFAVIVAACVVGWLVFTREAPRIAEDL